jgi:hypothetical protein
VQEDYKRALTDVVESVDRLKKGSYSSPDAFQVALLLSVAKLNAALLGAAQGTGYFGAFEMATRDVLTSVIRDLTEATTQNAAKFGASSWTLSFSGWPPTFGLSFTWNG